MSALSWIGDSFRINDSNYFDKANDPPIDLYKTNEELERMSLVEILNWAGDKTQKGNQLLPVTSFGLSGLVILHQLKQLGLLRKVVSIDTLHLFPETYEFINNWIQNEGKGVNLMVYKPRGYQSKQAFDQRFGEQFYITEPEMYSYISKVEPLERALAENNPKIWITGRRRSQGGERSDMRILEMDKKGRLKLNPLANWSIDDIWDYIKKNNIQYNSLYDQGYTSIGDVMTTSITSPGEGERSGRFVGMKSTECGCSKV